MNKLKLTLMTALLLSGTYASAAQTNFEVSTDIDPTLSMSYADGSAITDINLPFLVGAGIKPVSKDVTISSNDTNKNVLIKLDQDSILYGKDTTNTLPLDVKLGNKTLTTTETTYNKTELFNGSQSVTQKLIFTPRSSSTVNLAADDYSGVVTLVLTQSTQ